MLRTINVLVIAALICAAAYVYKVKFEATLQAERVAKLRNEIRREREAISVLRAEWTKVERPERVQTLAQQHLKLKPLDVAQFDDLSKLPERPPQIVPAGTSDPIGAIIEIFADAEVLTGTLTDGASARR
jgi:cell division protein FtsL